MSSDPIRRRETTHIDEVARTATSTTQWFAEKRYATHPITHNNQLKVLFCGEEGFADIATQIENAKETIDLVCWGFDPGMELRRGEGTTWPRGKTYGDLLIDAKKRGVKVRLLVWFDRLVAGTTRNMPGHSHGTSPWRASSGSTEADKISAKHSVAFLKANWQQPQLFFKGRKLRKITPEMIPLLAREEYCHSWYEAAFHGLLGGIEVRKRSSDAGSINRSLKSEQHQPGSITNMEVERAGLVGVGTHHQKTILIDFAYNEGSKAVGYVMGLNSVTDYWDTCEHKLEDPRREQGAQFTADEYVQGGEADPGFLSMKPYQDYACRIDGGKALIAIYNNFVTAWDRSIDDRMRTASNECVSSSECKAPPPALLRKAEPGNSTVQIVRTQPDENDKSIKDIYYLATDAATLASGYVYIENQYFQHEEWAQRLMQKRKDVIAAWKRGSAKAGKSMKDMPVMHVFIVIPVPERAQMIPRTHDTLSTLGQAGGMTGQNKMINDANENKRALFATDELGIATNHGAEIPTVVQHANEIEKRDNMKLESAFGIKVSVAMLQVSAYDKNRWRYREIYIHSKLLLVDDSFMTLGSANLNQRSMAVDSEMNIATNDAALARTMRHRVWMQHSGDTICGGGGTKQEIAKAFEEWTILMENNMSKKKQAAAMTGFLLPLKDTRSSTIRLG
jgi:phosphatidylserine/phosphatidylglycerophosphate/cardiolipin synthase-like enzyme